MACSVTDHADTLRLLPCRAGGGGGGGGGGLGGGLVTQGNR